jgi:hypothetical protein
MAGRAPASPAVPRLEIVSDGTDDVPPGLAEAWPDAAGGVFALCRSEGGRHWMDLPGVATLRFDAGGRRVAARPRAGVAPSAVADAYRHAALPMVLQALGAEVLHASAVDGRGGVVAFCGASGSGKSTLAYALHRRGHGLWADDAVALDVADDGAIARPLPFDVRLRPASAALFGLGPAAARLAASPGDRAPAPLAAVCLLDRGAGRARIERLPPAAAFPAVLTHAHCFSLRDAARKRLMLSRYLALVSRVPVFALGLEDDLGALGDAVAAVERLLGDG